MWELLTRPSLILMKIGIVLVRNQKKKHFFFEAAR
jgi:hypothetical protein